MLRSLLGNKLRIYLNLLRKAEGSRRARILALVALWLVLVGYVFQGSQALFRTAVQIAGPEAASKVLAPILFALLVALLLSGATICIHVMFISHDLPLLLSAPLSRRTVFVYKLIEATIGNSSLFVTLGMPVLLSFGIAQHAAWWYYPVMLAAAAIFLPVPTSLSAMVALLAVQVLPVRRAREVMSAALALVFLAVWTSTQLLRSSLDVHGAAEVGSILSFVHGNWLAATPAGWLAAVLSGLLRGRWMSVLVFGALLMASTAVMITVSVALVDAVYSRGVGREEFGALAAEIGNRHVRTAPSTRSLLHAAFLRDLRLLRREPTQLVQMVMLAVMMVVMAIILKRDTQGEPLSRLEMLMPFIFVVIFSAMSTVGISSRLIPLEGKAFYLTKIAPQPPIRSLGAKLLLGWILGTLLALFGAIVVTFLFGHSLFMGLGVFAITSLVCLGTSGMGLVLGAFFADFDWESPKRMITVGGGLISAVVPLVYAALLAALAFSVYQVVRGLFGMTLTVAAFAGACTAIAVSVGVAVASLIVAGRRVESLAWLY